ncbi:molybdopterin-dependent oxidoreductase [Halomicrococcus sp. NG-SE-24]|uniref:molybdopterin-dependent oxidoreductase n=1 Tax=Halomicrococcus sp. NG-SE-24 TaxID=3436928 RepID=UPI003D9749A5
MTRDTIGRRTNPATDTDDIDIVVLGSEHLSLTRADLDALSNVTRECTVTCASGERTTATWTGVPIPDLLACVTDPAATTHLRLLSDDGYCACVGIVSAVDALVAVVRDGEELATVERYGTRVVGPDIDGERSVKGVARIETVALGADQVPDELETLSLDDPRYG